MTPQKLKIAHVLSLLESSIRKNAIRFEPVEFQRLCNPDIINKIASIHHCTQATAKIVYCMSFGYYQIMGFNLYGNILDYQKSIFEFVDSPIDQFDMLSRFLKMIGFPEGPDFDNPENMLEFATRYNGSGDAPNYAKALRHSYDLIEDDEVPQFEGGRNENNPAI